MNRGFTIIEITIVIVITAIVLVMVGAMLVSQWQLYGSESALAEVKAQNIIAQKIIISTIEEGINVVASSTINGVNYVSDGDTIVLKLPSIDSNQNIIFGSFDYAAFDLDAVNSKIISNVEKSPLSARADGQKTIAQFVNNLNFGYNDIVWTSVNKIEITLVTTKQEGGVVRESRSFKAVKLKNK